MNLILNADNTLVVYLKASIQTLVGRLFKEKSKRPLLSHLELESELMEFIGKHLFERAPFYEQSNFVVKTNDLTIDAIVHHIILKLIKPDVVCPLKLFQYVHVEKWIKRYL